MLPPSPAFVTTMDVPTNATYDTYWGYSTREDSYGDIHSGDIVRVIPRDEDDVPEIEFITGGKYSYFSTTVFTTLIKEDHHLRFQFFADDNLVYDTGFVDRTFKEEAVKIDIAGIYALKIKCYRSGYVSAMGTAPEFCLQDMQFWF